MSELGSIVDKVRTKNAGPFWLTIDIFCGSPSVFERVARGVDVDQIASLFHVSARTVKRFDIPDLNVIKFSLPRPAIQGTVSDRDMHGAGWGPLVAEIEVA